MPTATAEDVETRRRNRRRRRLIVATVLGLALATLSVVFRRPWFQGNFGVVDPGRAYRSAQPVGDLPGLIQRRGLASVLNLRGGSVGDPWYVDEVRATRAAGVDFYDFPMNATRRPSRGELLVLIDLFERCRYPVLIHCKSGSDRTGLAAAIYRMVVSGAPPGEARRAFTVAYGHVPLFGTERLHEPLDEYASWLAARGLAHTPGRFRDWVERDYRSPGPVGPPPRLAIGPRFQGRAPATRADSLAPTRDQSASGASTGPS